MEKITLTKNDIKKEALHSIISILPEFSIIIGLLGFIFFAFLQIFAHTNGFQTYIWSFFILCLGILSIVAFFPFLYFLFEFMLVYKGKFSVETAILGNKQAQKGCPGSRRSYQPPKLFFPDKMQYIIDNEQKYYKWTKVMPMTGRRIFESADIGEEFYLVTIGQKRKKIIFIYNFQFFELKE